VAVHTAYLAKVGQWLGFYMGGGMIAPGEQGAGRPWDGEEEDGVKGWASSYAATSMGWGSR
jgi:hypothetical protein